MSNPTEDKAFLEGKLDHVKTLELIEDEPTLCEGASVERLQEKKAYLEKRIKMLQDEMDKA